MRERKGESEGNLEREKDSDRETESERYSIATDRQR